MAQDEYTSSIYLAGAQTTGATKYKWLIPAGQWRLQDAKAYLETAPVGAAFLIDINRNGTTIFTVQANRLTIADGAKPSTAFAPPPDRIFRAGDRLSIDTDQIGSGTAGSDLNVALMLVRV